MDGGEQWQPGYGWCTGPAGDRRRYRVASPEPLPGGQGWVFEAEGPDGEPVALKLVGDVDADVEARLDARWAAVIAEPHPHLARPLELFRGPGLFAGEVAPADDECDLLYLASRWVPGQTLRVVAPLDLAGVARVAVDVAGALAHLHDRCGLVHRDVHPGNVIVGDDGSASLIDLGAARPDDGTVTTTVSGMLGFIAPELTHGHGDRRADGWGLGMVVVFALLGHPQGSQPDRQLRRELLAALDAGSAAEPDRAVRLLEQAIAARPSDRPADPARWAAELAAALATGRRRRRVRRSGLVRPVAAGAALVLAAGLAAAALVDDGDGGGGDDAGAEAGPAADATATPPPDDVDCVPFATAAIAEAAGGTCAAGPAEPFGDAIVQAVPGGGDGIAGVVVQSPDGVVRLTTAQHVSYREIAGRDRPENAVTFGGYPVTLTERDGVGELALSANGLMVGARDDSQWFWLPDPVAGLWRGRGGATGDLGLPMTNPYFATDGMRQDFAGGYVTLPADAAPFPFVDETRLIVTLEPDPGAALRGIDVRGRLVRQPTGTAWFVDLEGRRHWVPDGDVYLCVGGDAAIVANDVPGPAIATLELGPPATCPDG